MTYEAVFRTRAEREMVELARGLTGLSQAAYTRAVLLKEAYTIVKTAKELEARGGISPEAATDNPVSGKAGSESADSNILADAAPADGAAE